MTADYRENEQYLRDQSRAYVQGLVNSIEAGRTDLQGVKRQMAELEAHKNELIERLEALEDELYRNR